jgi:hypothetical protein
MIVCIFEHAQRKGALNGRLAHGHCRRSAPPEPPIPLQLNLAAGGGAVTTTRPCIFLWRTTKKIHRVVQ